jgi:uncharacterized protein (DUF433 family)
MSAFVEPKVHAGSNEARHALALRDERMEEYAATMKSQIISRRPDVMGGTVVFHGTRVPVQTLLDYLEAGESIDDFLAGFPSVTRQQVIAFLEEAKDRLIETASCAPLFERTRSDDVFGSLKFSGRAKTLEEMDAGVLAEARRRYARD